MLLTVRYLAIERRCLKLAAGLAQRDWPHRLHPEVARLYRKAVFARYRAAVRKTMGL